jgi:ABC-2 type transport system permease protein
MTTRVVSRSSRRAPARAFRTLLLTEAKLAWREPLGLIWGLVFPVLLFVVFGLIPAFSEPLPTAGGLTLLSIYVPVLIAFALAMLALVGLAASLSSYREQGVLRRMSTTPIPPSWVLAVQLIIDLAFAAAAIVLIVGIGAIAFGVQGPKQVPGFLLALVLTAAALFWLGLVVAAVARTSRAAGAIGTILFFPLMFFAGLWIPRDLMPALLRNIGDFTPLGAAVQALQAASQGSFPPARPLLVLLGYALVLGVAAVRLFRWE